MTRRGRVLNPVLLSDRSFSGCHIYTLAPCTQNGTTPKFGPQLKVFFSKTLTSTPLAPFSQR